MKILRLGFLVGTFLFTAVQISVAALNIGEVAPDFTLSDSNGKERSLSDFRGQYVVLEWINYDCPFVKKHYKGGDMQSLQKDLTSKDVVWLSINSSAEGKQGNYPSEEINQIIKNSNSHPTAYLSDPSGKVGRSYGATTTPHMYVIDPKGNLIYQGAIDDMPSFDPKDIPNSTNYVLTALNEAMEGRPVSVPSTKSYGCSVKY